MTAPPIKLRSPAELLAVIPHLLGFEPQHALVVMALRDSKIDLTARIDLPAPERVEEVAEALFRHVRREAAEAVLLVGYEDTAGESRPLLDTVTEQLGTLGVSIRDRLVVHDGRWRSLHCDRPSCCPPEGTPLPMPADVADPIVEFIGQGSAPLPDRRTLAAQLEEGAAARDVADLLEHRPPTQVSLADTRARHRLAEVWTRVLTRPEGALGIADAAVALQSLKDTSTRDGLAAVLVPNGLELDVLPEDTRALVDACSHAVRALVEEHGVDMTPGAVKSRLIDLCRHATHDHAAPALTLLATYSWWHGDGALARVALDRALRCDRDYRLAQLLTLMLDEGIRPDRP
ncbi:DUF4192 domain-containing protein [Intrasporangium sp. YIM S08009]|uniref:DUF4192 domain-containing protein n=1 Tax=Intrasporangium zincisolvens TaxID=3080018 RepID=UPI002B05CDD3|nr:DUF4192 domain-containing protein [Intrasporangium sp. YIM S08009]